MLTQLQTPYCTLPVQDSWLALRPTPLPHLPTSPHPRHPVISTHSLTARLLTVILSALDPFCELILPNT